MSAPQRTTRTRSKSIDQDDSTDDDKVTSSVKNYDLQESWEKLSNNPESGNYNKNNLEISFILHAFGRGIYYSEPVNAIYEKSGGLKESHISDSSWEDGKKRKALGSKITLPKSEGRTFFRDEIDLLAHMRLSNRAERRVVKDVEEKLRASTKKQHNGASYEDFGTRETKWSFSSKKSTSTKHSVQRKKNLYRSDEVMYSYPPKEDKFYPLSYNKISARITDRDVATAKHIRSVLKGEAAHNDKFITDLTYHLFGCESSRNPSCLVVNHMMLDLVEKEVVKFADLFTGDNPVMPMAPSGSLSAARTLNELFNNYMPVSHVHDGPTSYTAEDLVNNEANLAKKWLATKLGILDTEISPTLLKQQLVEAIQVWYKDVNLSRFIGKVVAEEQDTPEQESGVEQEEALEGSKNEDNIDLSNLALAGNGEAMDIDLSDSIQDGETSILSSFKKYKKAKDLCSFPSSERIEDEMLTEEDKKLDYIRKEIKISLLDHADEVLEDGNTVLHWCAYLGLDDECKELIERMTEGQVSIIGQYGQSAISWALSSESLSDDVKQKILDKTTEETLNTPNQDNNYPLQIAARKNSKLFNQILNKSEHNAIYARLDNLIHKRNIIHMAAANNLDDILKTILESNKFDLRKIDETIIPDSYIGEPRPLSALHIAMLMNHMESAVILINNGAEITQEMQNLPLYEVISGPPPSSSTDPRRFSALINNPRAPSLNR